MHGCCCCCGCWKSKDCAAYLIEKREFKYVLLGHLQSDDIESRFGWLRQLSGANYYISVRQVLESDRKIRAVSLLKCSKISLGEIDECLQTESSESQPAAAAAATAISVDSVADPITDALTFRQFLTASDCNTIFYVSGNIARSIIRTMKCEHCKESLITTDPLEPLEIDRILDYTAATFMDTMSINRGGFARPTDYAFLLAVHCWRVFEEIKAIVGLMSPFLAAASHRILFCKIMERAKCMQTFGHQPIDSNYCFNGHDLNQLIVTRFFNCVAKNQTIVCYSNATFHIISGFFGTCAVMISNVYGKRSA